MTPDEIRLACLKLALEYGLAKRPDFTLDVAKQFETYVASGTTGDDSRAWARAVCDEAVRRAREEARKVMGENHDP